MRVTRANEDATAPVSGFCVWSKRLTKANLRFMKHRAVTGKCWLVIVIKKFVLTTAQLFCLQEVHIHRFFWSTSTRPTKCSPWRTSSTITWGTCSAPCPRPTVMLMPFSCRSS